MIRGSFQENNEAWLGALSIEDVERCWEQGVLPTVGNTLHPMMVPRC